MLTKKWNHEIEVWVMDIYGNAICVIVLSENTKAKRSQAKK